MSRRRPTRRQDESNPKSIQHRSSRSEVEFELSTLILDISLSAVYEAAFFIGALMLFFVSFVGRLSSVGANLQDRCRTVMWRRIRVAEPMDVHESLPGGIWCCILENEGVVRSAMRDDPVAGLFRGRNGQRGALDERQKSAIRSLGRL